MKDLLDFLKDSVIDNIAINVSFNDDRTEAFVKMPFGLPDETVGRNIDLMKESACSITARAIKQAIRRDIEKLKKSMAIPAQFMGTGIAQSCKITIGNNDAGHTVHFPDGCNEHVEARPFENIDGIIERAVKQRAERETHKADNSATPAYYRFRINGADCDVFDIAKSARLTPASTMALKYLLRAGKKGGAVDDLRKCIRCVEREIELGEGAK
jgi:hypothetical protein